MSEIQAPEGQHVHANGPPCVRAAADAAAARAASDPTRRRFFQVGTALMGGVIGLVLAVPGVAFLLDPLRRKGKASGLRDLPVTLAELQVGVPRQFPIVDDFLDAWIQYPPEPVGAVWLVKQPDGSNDPVLAFTAECPHLGCAINLAPDGTKFLCPCHTSAFKLDGERMNKVPPRPMDQLEVEVARNADGQPDPGGRIRVKFERFRSQLQEKIPRA